MGPIKAVVRHEALYDARSGALIRAGFSSKRELCEYADRHYVVLPEADKAGRSWEWEGVPVYCLHGARYETLDNQSLHVARCPDCGGMAVRMEELTVERDCSRCTMCGHECDARLEMMES